MKLNFKIQSPNYVWVEQISPVNSQSYAARAH